MTNSHPLIHGAGARTVLHLDLDAFFCSVEELTRPELRGVPFAVGGTAGERGVISSCSYAARHAGVRSAMPTARALRLCPSLVMVRGHYRRYSAYSDRVMDELQNISGLVQQMSIDEAYADISDIREPALEVAKRLQAAVLEKTGLPCSIGVGANPLMAKIATEVGKHNSKGTRAPMAITIVKSGAEAEFLEPLPLQMLWGVGPKTLPRLAAMGLRTIGDLAKLTEQDLTARFGEYGRDLWQHARGIDTTRLSTEHVAKSMSQETTFARDERDDKRLEQVVRELARQVAESLRRDGLAARTVRIKVRWPNFETLTRQVSRHEGTADEKEIASAAIALLQTVRQSGQAVRLIGVGTSGLGPPEYQLDLWNAKPEQDRRLDKAIDAIHERYGDKSLVRGPMKGSSRRRRSAD